VCGKRDGGFEAVESSRAWLVIATLRPRELVNLDVSLIAPALANAIFCRNGQQDQGTAAIEELIGLTRAFRQS